MLITPAPSVYNQSSLWLHQRPLCRSSHHADFFSTLFVYPVIMLISPALFVFSHHAQTLLVPHYIRRHLISLLGTASLNNPLPKIFTYYEKFAGSERVARHSAGGEKMGCKRYLWGFWANYRVILLAICEHLQSSTSLPAGWICCL